MTMKFKIGDKIDIVWRARAGKPESRANGEVVNVIPGNEPDGRGIVEPYCVKREDRETPGWFSANKKDGVYIAERT